MSDERIEGMKPEMSVAEALEVAAKVLEAEAKGWAREANFKRETESAALLRRLAPFVEAAIRHQERCEEVDRAEEECWLDDDYEAAVENAETCATEVMQAYRKLVNPDE